MARSLVRRTFDLDEAQNWAYENGFGLYIGQGYALYIPNPWSIIVPSNEGKIPRDREEFLKLFHTFRIHLDLKNNS